VSAAIDASAHLLSFGCGFLVGPGMKDTLVEAEPDRQ
jgi:hypothetical protein